MVINLSTKPQTSDVWKIDISKQNDNVKRIYLPLKINDLTITSLYLSLNNPNSTIYRHICLWNQSLPPPCKRWVLENGVQTVDLPHGKSPPAQVRGWTNRGPTPSEDFWKSISLYQNDPIKMFMVIMKIDDDVHLCISADHPQVPGFAKNFPHLRWELRAIWRRYTNSNTCK